MDFVPLLALAVLVKKTIDYVRVLVPQELHAKVLLPVSLAVGVGYALLFSASNDLSRKIDIWSDQTLATADLGLVIVYGLVLGAAGGVLHDAVKSRSPSGI